MNLRTYLLLALLLFTVMPAHAGPDKSNHNPESFPVPKGIANMMFYVQRSSNTNTIAYELNMKKGVLDDEEPIHGFWLRYDDEQGARKELSYIQKKFAYGLKIKKLSSNDWQVKFVSYQKRILHLQKATDGKYYVFTDINGKRAVLTRLFINIEGGSFWKPNVTFIELKGRDVATGMTTTERILNPKA